jgi:hypothetical protein
MEMKLFLVPMSLNDLKIQRRCQGLEDNSRIGWPSVLDILKQLRKFVKWWPQTTELLKN